MRTFVDTNVFLRFIDGDKDSIAFFKMVKSGVRTFWVQAVVVSELIWVLRTSYGWSVAEVVEVVESFVRTKNLKLVTKCRVPEALRMYREKNVKYNDCVIVSAMERGDRIVSLDHEFDRFEGIKRVEPRDLIG